MPTSVCIVLGGDDEIGSREASHTPEVQAADRRHTAEVVPLTWLSSCVAVMKRRLKLAMEPVKAMQQHSLGFLSLILWRRSVATTAQTLPDYPARFGSAPAWLDRECRAAGA